MRLVDTNVILEILLGQDKVDGADFDRTGRGRQTPEQVLAELA